MSARKTSPLNGNKLRLFDLDPWELWMTVFTNNNNNNNSPILSSLLRTNKCIQTQNYPNNIHSSPGVSCLVFWEMNASFVGRQFLLLFVRLSALCFVEKAGFGPVPSEKRIAKQC